MANFSGSGTKDDPWDPKTCRERRKDQMIVTMPRTLWLTSCARSAGTCLQSDAGVIDVLDRNAEGAGRTGCRAAGADEQKPAPDGSVEAWGRFGRYNLLGGRDGFGKGLRGRFGRRRPAH